MRTLFSNIPSIDLHAFDRDYAKICIKDFVMDNYKLKKEKVAIIHGIGTGILRKATTEVLKHNKYVDSYKIDNFNSGMTIVTLKRPK